MDKKIFTIEINGIKESVEAITSLNKQLDALDKRINELNSRKVTVQTTVSNKPSSSNASALNEEAAIEKEILALKNEGTKLEAKQVAYQDESYQKVLAQKDVLKEIVEDQKTIAAQERLQADTYSNTMQGMKAKLADLKTSIASTDLGDNDKIKSMTAEANELTNKLKEMEEAYGQFGRNVGNYNGIQSNFKKITVQVGETTREFNSVREASKQLSNELKGMVINGQENTKEFDDLSKAVHEFEMNVKKANSALDDLKASSKGMDDLLDTFQSFTALGQVGQGATAFFGFDNAEIQRSIQKLVALQNVMQGIEKIRLQMNTKEGLGKLFSSANTSVDKFVAKITGAELTMNGLTKSTRAATLAVKGLSLALKSIGVGLVMFGLEKLVEIFEKISDNMKYAEIQAKHLDETFNSLNENFKVRNDLLSSAYLKGEMSDEQFLAKQYQNQNDYLIEQLVLLRERASLFNKQDEKKHNFFSFNTDSNWVENGNFTGQRMTQPISVESYSWINDLLPSLEITVNNIKEVETEFERCNQAIKEGKDYFSKWGSGLNDWLNSLMATVSDTENAMRGLGNAKLSDFIGSFEEANIEFKKGQLSAEEYAKKIGELKKELNSNEVLRSVVLNLDKYIPEEGVRTAVQSIINQLIKLDDAFNMTSEEQVHHWNQVRIDGMKKGSAKIKAQIDEDERYEIEKYGKTQEQVNLIRNKYARKREEELKKEGEQNRNKWKQHAKDVEAAEKDLAQLRIANMKDGLDKQLAQLNEEKREKLKAVEISGILVAERRGEIETLYDKKILDAKKDWANKIEQVYTKLWDKIFDLNQNSAKLNFENQIKEIELEYEKLMDASSNKLGGNVSSFSNRGISISQKGDGYKVLIEKDESYTKRLESEFENRFKARSQYLDESEKLTIDKVTKTYEAEIDIAGKSKNHELRTLKNSYKQEDEELEQHLKKGEISQKDYDDAVKRLGKERGEYEAAIEDKYRLEFEEKERKHQNDIMQIKRDSYNSLVDEYSSYIDKLSDLDTSDVVRNGFGITNITATKKRNDKLLKIYKDTFDKISNEITRLKSKLDSSDLTQDERKQIEATLENLTSLQGRIQNTIVNIKDNTKNAVSELMNDINQYLQEFANVMGSVLDAMWTAEDAEFEREQENLEKQLDAVKEYYDKMDEAAKDHADNMKSLESDIASAQGDARDRLIQRYNAEKQAQREALKEKKKAEKEEEKLKKRQEELDIEQRKKQKERDLIQAAINTAMAITSAAVNHWPIPAVPMMAAAAAAGAAQIAAIQSKQYANGGQLDGGVAVGNRHSNGGIKVLGGRAEIEGGEFITNRQTTMNNVALLEFINSSKKRVNLDDMIEFYGGKKSKVASNVLGATNRKYADGGTLPIISNYSNNDALAAALERYANRPTYVAVTDIIDKTADVNNVRVMAGLGD